MSQTVSAHESQAADQIPDVEEIDKNGQAVEEEKDKDDEVHNPPESTNEPEAQETINKDEIEAELKGDEETEEIPEKGANEVESEAQQKELKSK